MNEEGVTAGRDFSFRCFNHVITLSSVFANRPTDLSSQKICHARARVKSCTGKAQGQDICDPDSRLPSHELSTPLQRSSVRGRKKSTYKSHVFHKISETGTTSKYISCYRFCDACRIRPQCLLVQWHSPSVVILCAL